MTDEYYDIDFRQKHPTVKGYWVQADKFTEMYRKATALDKIRAEIEESITDYILDEEDTNTAIRMGDIMTKVFEIIDKYR